MNRLLRKIENGVKKMNRQLDKPVHEALNYLNGLECEAEKRGIDTSNMTLRELREALGKKANPWV